MRIGQAMSYILKHVETFPFPHTVANCYSVLTNTTPMFIAMNRPFWSQVSSHAQSVVDGSRLPRLPPENKGGNLKISERKPKVLFMNLCKKCTQKLENYD